MARSSALKPQARERILDNLNYLYGRKMSPGILEGLESIVEDFCANRPQYLKKRDLDFKPRDRFTHRDSALITYGDSIVDRRRPLTVLNDFLTKTRAKDAFSIVHILPFFPYSSDKGFSIIDFEAVDPSLGGWDDIEKISKRFRFMNDLVLNHASAQGEWFSKFLKGDPGYWDFFMAYKRLPSKEMINKVRRPRQTPIFSKMKTKFGEKYVWNTFMPEDQMDLNYKNPDVLLEMTRILLAYLNKGGNLIRLDAITYLWKEFGTDCANLRQNYKILNIFRTVVDEAAPAVSLITETNVPHGENISYFGDARDKGAHMVYNFALPPLTLHTFHTGNVRKIASWAKRLNKHPRDNYFFNFLDSHDGVGITPVKNLLSEAEINNLMLKTLEHGGRISYKSAPGSPTTPYEMNISWYSALNNEIRPEESRELRVRRFLASRFLAVSVGKGIPATYFPSLFGATNNYPGFNKSRSNRDLNRPVIREPEIKRALADPNSRESMVFRSFTGMLAKLRKQEELDPRCPTAVAAYNNNVLMTVRRSFDDFDKAAVLVTNASKKKQEIRLSPAKLKMKGKRFQDIISGKKFGGNVSLTLPAYGYAFIKRADQ